MDLAGPQQIQIELGPVHSPALAGLQQLTDVQQPGVRLSTIYSIRLMNCLMILLILPIFAFLIVVLALQWNQSCSTPLKLWALIQIFIDGLLMLNHIIIVLRLPWLATPPHQQLASIIGIRSNTAFIRLMHLCWFSWWVVGLVWVFQALSDGYCPSVSPFLYWSVFSVMMFHTVVAAFSVLFCAVLFIWSVLRAVCLRSRNAVIYLAPHNRGATASEIAQLTTVKKYVSGLMDEESAMCAICLDPYENGQEIRMLPCSELHHFHKHCVDQWLQSNRVCPLCKRTLEGVVEA